MSVQFTYAQTLGGNAAFTFLTQSFHPQLSALGGVEVATPLKNGASAIQNPALLRADQQSWLNTGFTQHYADIRQIYLSQVVNSQPWNTTFQGHIGYQSYGSIVNTDQAGQVLGTIQPREWFVQLNAAKQYENYFHYGIAMKVFGANYGIAKSSGMAFDVGGAFEDQEIGITAGLSLRNMGWQWQSFGTDKEEIPFTMTAGIAKQLINAPFRFHLTYQHMHRWNLQYIDTNLLQANGFTPRKSNFLQQFSDHLVLATDIQIGAPLAVTLGYNFLRRRELTIPGTANGLTGFSAGASATFTKWQCHYSAAWFSNAQVIHQLGISLRMNQLLSWSVWDE